MIIFTKRNGTKILVPVNRIVIIRQSMDHDGLDVRVDGVSTDIEVRETWNEFLETVQNIGR